MSLRSILLLGTVLTVSSSALAQTAGEFNSLLREGASAPRPAAPAPAQQATPTAPAQQTAPAPQAAPVPTGAGEARSAKSGTTTTLPKGELRDLGTEATVFIAVFKGGRYAGSGSGFFIAPDLVMTNDHVASAGDQLVVFASDRSRTIGKIFMRSETRAVGDHDFAVLKLEESVGKRTVSFGTSYKSLTDVVAFGFPGKVMSTDRQFGDVFRGDQRAIPTITLSSGAIHNVLENTQHVEVLTHSAKIAPGNSGGPLFDTCGRVIGINTYEANQKIMVAAEKKGGSSRAVDVPQGYQWALSSAEMVKFLRSRAVDVPVSSDPCE